MDLLERLGLDIPIVQAGMGGGVAGARLAGAVSAAGGLGTVGILDPDPFERSLHAARELAPGRPVAANLLLPYTRRRHVEACVRSSIPVVALHLGFDPGIVTTLREAGIFVLHQVGTVEQATRAIADGADALIVQGLEAGGHLVAELPLADALGRVLEVAGDRPVLAAGGIAEASDVRRLLDAGAVAAVAGTRFLLTDESRAHAEYKRRLLGAERTLDTVLFGFGFPARHRVVPNRATDRWCGEDERGPRWATAVNRRTGALAKLLPLRAGAVAARLQRPSFPILSPAVALEGMPDRVVESTPLYAGTGTARIHSILPAASAVRELAGISPARE